MGDWKKISSTIPYKNPWYQIREDKVILPNGKDGTYSVVEYHKPGVSVIPLENDGVYLVKNFRYPLQENFLEFIVGGVAQHPTPLAAAQAELKEEAGFTAEKWTELPMIALFAPICNLQDTVFIAEGLTKGERHLEGNEKISLPQWYSFDSLKKMIKDGEITSVSTLAGILIALNYANKI